jgi:proteasome beta subunit
MGTVVALESRDGVAIAGDTRVVDGETVTSQTVQRVFDFDTIGVGVVGKTGDIQEFRRYLEDELRTVRAEQEGEVKIDELARIAARQAEKTNVSAAVATHDSEGVARLREVGSDGQILETRKTALGSGAKMAFGQLETIELDVGLDEAISNTTDLIENVKRRDTDSGGDIDVWSLPNSTDS